MVLTLKITVGCPSCTGNKHAQKKKKNLYTRVGLLGPFALQEKWRAVGKPARADACAFRSKPQLSSYRRRFHTDENREKTAQMLRTPSSACLEPLQRSLHTCVRLLGPCLKTLLRICLSC